MGLITEGAYNRNKIIILKQALAVHVDHIRFFIWGGFTGRWAFNQGGL